MDTLLQDCFATLQKVASYKLPAPIDRRLLFLSENKETLNDVEREELLALIDFAEDRTVEKLQAKLILRRLGEAFPQHFADKPVTIIWPSLREAVVLRAENQCEYCQLGQDSQVATFRS